MFTEVLEKRLDLATGDFLAGLHVLGEDAQAVAVGVRAIGAVLAQGACDELAALPSAIVAFKEGRRGSMLANGGWDGEQARTRG